MPQTLTKPVVRYNTQLLAEDIAAKGWMPVDAARRSGLSSKTVTRFLSGEFQTAKTAKRLAEALGRSVSRYLVRQAEAV